MDSVSNGFFHDDENNVENHANDEKFNEILSKMSDMEKLIRQMNTSISIVNDEVVELKKSDLYNIKCELLEVQTKLNDLINKKAPSLRDEDDQVLANLLDDEFQSHLAAANASQLNSNFTNQSQLSQLQQNSMQYYLAQQTAAAAAAGNPYANSLYNSSYPMYGIYPPFINYTQTAQAMGGTTIKQPAHLLEIQKSISELSPQLNDSRLLDSHASMFAASGTHQSQVQQPKSIYDQPDRGLPQNTIHEMISTSNLYKSLYPNYNTPVEKSAPVNVVITTSDPLPTHSQITTQPPLSVTIPPQHIKNSNNIYNQNDLTTMYEQAFLPPHASVAPNQYQQIPSIISTESTQQTTIPPAISTIVTQKQPTAPPPPKFENENEIFSGHAKFFKSVIKDKDTKEWKEEADGQVKLLTNKKNKKSRIVIVQDDTYAIVLDFPINDSTKFQTTNKPNLKMANWSGADPMRSGEFFFYFFQMP